MSVSPARKIAFDVLRRVASHRAYASELLYTRLGPRISPADAALATELTLGVLRWQRLLDFLLARCLDRNSKPASKRVDLEVRLDLEVLLALRLGLYQLRFLDRIPAHAAVSESVELVKTARKRSAASLVNAVLRRAAREANISGERLEALLPPDTSCAERAAILHSHPTWLVERWIGNFGLERTMALLAANNRPPLLSCAVLDPQADRVVLAALQESGAMPARWLRSALTLKGGNPAGIEAFQLGKISFQDEASQMVAHLAGALHGQRVLDVCAAPGGKTTLLARAVLPDGMVIAADLHEHRLRSIREQLARTGTQNVSLLAIDASQPLPFVHSFDRILVDAPCSGTGTLARNPEIRWRLEPDLLSLAQRAQTAMLHQALTLVRPGGRLVYATCSLEPEENERVVHETIKLATRTNKNVRIVSGRAALEPHLQPGVAAAELFDTQGFFRTFPPESQTDGFFAAVLELVA